eukprot:6892193-Lingulodinium_polyedra.AAC.1
MQDPSVGPHTVHALRCLEALPVLGLVYAASRGDDAAAPSVRGPEHGRDAVAVFPRADALPAMLSAATTAGQQLGLQARVRAGA